MELRITKNANKPHTIVYKRDDGSETWMQTDEFFVRHDLSHYAIEKTMQYKTAFMGMLNNGMGIRDFEDREKRLKMQITDEAWYAENMANLFLIEIAQGRFDDFNKVSTDAFAKMERAIPPPVLSASQIEAIRKYLSMLLTEWNKLPVDETMLLTFEF
ncbi:MAG: hypothetical protein QM726_17150 [Chitinophagaceae bacterium]